MESTETVPIEGEEPRNPALIVGELFDLTHKVQLGQGTRDQVELQAKYSLGHNNFFALVLKQ